MTSQSRLRRASIPTPFVPSGHFPLIGGIGPWEGSLGAGSDDSIVLSGAAGLEVAVQVEGGEKSAWGRGGVLPLNSGWNQCFRRHSTRESPYGRHTTRRLIRGYQIRN